MKTTDFITEGIGQDADNMHKDHEVQMARQDCYNAAKDAIDLHKLLATISEMQGLEGWVSEKITLAADYLRTVKEYFEYEQMSQEQSLLPEFTFEDAEAQMAALLEDSSDEAMAAFLAKGGEIKQGAYKKPRKSEKTDYGSKHIGGAGDKMRASRTGVAAKTQGSKIVGMAEEQLDELSPELLGRYKKAASAASSAADKAGDYDLGHKRYKGIIKATKKQFAHDVKKHQEQDVAEGVAETLPMQDAVKVLRYYGADHFKTTTNELHFYKNGRGLSVDLVMNPDTTRSVTLSSLNSATRALKGQGVAEGSDNIRSMIQQYEDMVELVYDLPPGRKKNIAIDKRDALEAQIEAMPGGSEALRKWARAYNDSFDEGVAEGGPFSYGAKKPRRGSVADLAAKKRKEQDKNYKPTEPKDQMVGTAKVTKGVAESYTGRETKDGTWRVFKDGKAVAVAGPFKSREEVSAWIKKQKQGVAEGDTTKKLSGATPAPAPNPYLKDILMRHIEEVRHFVQTGYIDPTEPMFQELYEYFANEIPEPVRRSPSRLVRRIGDMIAPYAKFYASASTMNEQGVAEGFKNTYNVGDRVNGPLGTGTIVAVSPNINADGRVKVKLDDPGRAGEDGKYKDSFVLDTTQLTHINEQGVAEGLSENRVDSPVSAAITRRILNQHLGLLQKYGPQAVMDAIDQVADWVDLGPDDEIGTSDVSGWVQQVIRYVQTSAGEGITESAGGTGAGGIASVVSTLGGKAKGPGTGVPKKAGNILKRVSPQIGKGIYK